MRVGTIKDSRFGLTPREVTKLILNNPYAWPGGYAMMGVTRDGALLCPRCIRENLREIVSDLRDGYNSGWTIVGYLHAGEVDRPEDEYCAHCDRKMTDL